MLIEINSKNIDTRLIKQCVDVLNRDGLIIIPTDTVYAIACRIGSKKALEKLAKHKNTKLKNANFSLLFNDLGHLSNYVLPIERSVFKLLNRNLPGPFTFILEANAHVRKTFDTNKKEVGIRIPDNAIVHELVRTLGEPIVSSSLHDSEDELLDYFIDPYEIYQRFEDEVELIIDGGLGKLYASTVVDCTGGEAVVLREGIGELLL